MKKRMSGNREKYQKSNQHKNINWKETGHSVAASVGSGILSTVKRSAVLLIALAVFGVLTLITQAFESTQSVQLTAKDWDDSGKSSMVSVFFKDGEGIAYDDIAKFEYMIQQTLDEKSVEIPENARSFISAASVRGTASVSSERAAASDINAYAVTGDFFKFHDFGLISGNYLDANELMDDYVVLDENAAWKLFGAIAVDGKEVTVNGKVMRVAGIVENESGFLTKRAGASENGNIFFFMSHMLSDNILSDDKLDKGNNAFGTCSTYEIVAPNTVKGLALGVITDTIKNMGIADTDCVIVENSVRYSFVNSVKRMWSFVDKGMEKKGIAFPYWENAAKGVENIEDVIVVFRVIALAVATVWAVVLFAIVYKKTNNAVKAKIKKIRGVHYEN